MTSQRVEGTWIGTGVSGANGLKTERYTKIRRSFSLRNYVTVVFQNFIQTGPRARQLGVKNTALITRKFSYSGENIPCENHVKYLVPAV